LNESLIERREFQSGREQLLLPGQLQAQETTEELSRARIQDILRPKGTRTVTFDQAFKLGDLSLVGQPLESVRDVLIPEKAGDLTEAEQVREQRGLIVEGLRGGLSEKEIKQGLREDGFNPEEFEDVIAEEARLLKEEKITPNTNIFGNLLRGDAFFGQRPGKG